VTIAAKPYTSNLSLYAVTVIARKATVATAANKPTFVTTVRARSRIAPSVFSAKKIAPCVMNTESVTNPPNNPYGLSRLKKPPVYSITLFCTSSGTPRTMLAKATPHSSAGTKLEITIALSQRARHFASPYLLRYSIATPRTISAIKIKNSGR